MTILVTGAAGFIAHTLIKQLLKDKQKVIGIDNFSLGKRLNIQPLLSEDNFKFVEGDINKVLESDALKHERFSAIYHLAANSNINKSIKNPSIDYLNTLQTSYTVLEFMRKNHLKKIIFASSSAIFGNVGFNKVSEGYGPLNPISHYGAAKMASEAFISSYCACYDISALVLRFPNVVGPFATHGVIFDFVSRLKQNAKRLDVLGDGAQEKPYLHVEDLIKAIKLVNTDELKGFEVFNIGNNTTSNVRRISEIVCTEMGISPDINFEEKTWGWIGDVTKFDFDISKILSTGWKPKYNSDEAIKHTARWLISYGH
jgi:UDP-glucose 4-epimerase